MNPIIAFIKLIRLPNLLIIVLTQYMLRYFILKPLVEVKGFELLISDFLFFLLSLSMVLIAAGGYVINDYFDIKIDRINKPDKIIIGNGIKRRVAMGAHVVLSSLGFILGAFVSYRIDNTNLVFIHLFAIISLWYYSSNFKYSLLGGNLVIALLAALIPLTVGLYEVPILNVYIKEYYAQMLKVYDFNFNYIAYWCIGYAAFAFLITLAREITKDIADIEGDQAFDATTVPITWGITAAKSIIITIYLIIIALLIYTLFNFVRDAYTITYFFTLLVLPIGYSSFVLIKGKERNDFIKSSNINKLVAVFGVLYPLLFSYVLKQYMEQASF